MSENAWCEWTALPAAVASSTPYARDEADDDENEDGEEEEEEEEEEEDGRVTRRASMAKGRCEVSTAGARRQPPRRSTTEVYRGTS